MKVAVVTTHIAPARGYGGPAVSARLLAECWAESGAELMICASDASEGPLVRKEDLILGANVTGCLYHAHWFRRWGFGVGAIPAVVRACYGSDAIYVNGIATWPTTLAAWMSYIFRRRFVIALRGGLMPEHVDEIRSKKRLKWYYYQLLVLPMLRRAWGIHCTGRIEAEHSSRVLGGAGRVFVVPNGVSMEGVTFQHPPASDGLTLCFLGRISYEKGINSFIKAWLDVRRAGDKIIVAGSGYGDYFQKFQSLVKAGCGAIDYRGYLDGDGVASCVIESHFVILPSGLEGGVRENFGNVVAEAFKYARPAIVAKGLAWDHLEEEKIGFLFERNVPSAKEAIRRAQALTQTQRLEMAVAARKYAQTHLNSAVTTCHVWRYLAGDRM